MVVMPDMEELQTDANTRSDWIDYSAYDAKATWDLYQSLKAKLQ